MRLFSPDFNEDDFGEAIVHLTFKVYRGLSGHNDEYEIGSLYPDCVPREFKGGRLLAISAQSDQVSSELLFSIYRRRYEPWTRVETLYIEKYERPQLDAPSAFDARVRVKPAFAAVDLGDVVQTWNFDEYLAEGKNGGHAVTQHKDAFALQTILSSALCHADPGTGTQFASLEAKNEFIALLFHYGGRYLTSLLEEATYTLDFANNACLQCQNHVYAGSPGHSL